MPVTLPEPSGPQHQRYETSLPSYPGDSFLLPPSAGTGREKSVKGACVSAFICRERWGLYIYVGWSMNWGPHLTKAGQTADIAVEGVCVLR